ncbi:replicative DNA helicase [Chitinophaga barathri]|uniref:Replicative DNA helicase n=1 Tax=Chitinophaga barathri TaxID=1647451 RepID=A0A3N4MGL8_9BACT|nr:replicative DNA helicase [Chitinophaga barathri]RPD39240.1 replicative DNA helicase [Chitinophaga barathri]
MDLNLKKDRNTRRKPGVDISTMVYGKIPPQAKELEEAVLGALMLEKGAFDVVIEILKAECFYVDAHQKIFGSMQRLAAKSMPVDILTVVEELKSSGDLEVVGGPFAVTRLTNLVVSSANIEAHARIVLQKFIQRELIRISGEIISEAYEDTADVFDLLDAAESKLFEVTNNHLRKNYDSIDRVLVNTIKRIEDLRNKGDDITGVPSGFPSLDKITYGWQPSDLIILAARPAVGKTAFALNLARNAALHPKFPKGAAVFSLEMSSGQIVQRILSAESEIHLEKITRGKLEEHEMRKLMTHGIERLAKAPIFIDDTPGLNIFELRAKARRLVHNHGVGIIIIDYLQLMSGSADGRNTNREQEISKISRDLKGLAKELHVPVLALSQLSRDVEKRKDGNKMPQLSDLRESGAIEQDADMVMFIYRPEYYDITTNEHGESNKGETHVRIAKHRNGQLDTVKLRAVLQFQRFEDDGFVDGPPAPAGGGGNSFAGMKGHQGSGSYDEAKIFIQKGSKMNDMDFEDDAFGDAPF